jgi:hypothetical protein
VVSEAGRGDESPGAVALRAARTCAPALAAVVVVRVAATYVPLPGSAAGQWTAAYVASTIFGGLVCAMLLAGARLVLVPRLWLLGAGATCLALGVGLAAANAGVVADAVKLASALLLGCLLATLPEQGWWLAPGAVAISLADVWSVGSSNGVTHHAVTSSPTLVRWVSIAVPAPRPADLTVGVTDFVFLSLFVASAFAWDMGGRRVAVACALGLPAIVAAEQLSPFTALPALPVFSLAFLAAAAPGLVRSWLQRRR